MRHSWIAVLAALPLITGAALHPTLPIPAAQPPLLVQGGFIDRLLQDSRPRRKASPKRRTQRSSAARPSAARPAPALPAVIPVPLPKPGGEAQNAAEPPQQPAPTTAAPPQPAPAAPEDAPAPIPAPAPAPAPATAPAPAPTPAPDPASPSASAPQTQPPTVEQPGTPTEPPHAAEVPTPEPKPADTAAPTTPAPEGAAPAEPAPPGETPAAPDQQPKDNNEQAAPEEPAPLPIAKEDPEELKACIADLTAIGGKFKETATIDEGEGCGIDKPLEVAEILPGVSTGGAVMRCKTALSLSRWIKNTAQPALDIAKPGRKIVSLAPGSTYACRLRNNGSTGKISEHARGNAFDVAGFKLDNGDTIEMKPRDDDHTLEGAFQKTATAGACLHFTTVLAPGSDAAHENHLHLDTMERNGDYRICE